MKRLFDIIASLLGLLLTLWLFLLLALWIKCDSAGPVFFRQERVGRGGKPFRILKFRTMRPDSDRGIQVTVGEADSRITRSGRFIRKWKLDELPQLVNVLRGEMSLVGPRPETPKYVAFWTAEQRHVLDVRPGITDPASIRYRNENEMLAGREDPERYYIEVLMQEKLALQLEYVCHHSFWGDIGILFQTFLAVVKG